MRFGTFCLVPTLCGKVGETAVSLRGLKANDIWYLLIISSPMIMSYLARGATVKHTFTFKPYARNTLILTCPGEYCTVPSPFLIELGRPIIFSPHSSTSLRDIKLAFVPVSNRAGFSSLSKFGMRGSLNRTATWINSIGRCRANV